VALAGAVPGAPEEGSARSMVVAGCGWLGHPRHELDEDGTGGGASTPGVGLNRQVL